jgi:D-alanine-D-alanine ligase
VLVLVHEDLVPPDSIEGLSHQEILPFKTEYDVVASLENMGHTVKVLGVYDDLGVIRETIRAFKPRVVFNLLEEFHGESLYDQHVVSYLELLRQAYTGCNPRGLTLAHDKALSKKICAYHRIPVPGFAVFPRRQRVRRPKSLDFPLIVKSLTLEGSVGIAQASIVWDDDRLRERVEYMHEQVGTDVIAEQYIEGRELYIGVLGNQRLTVFPTWELRFENKPESSQFIASDKLKWDLKYRERIGANTGPAEELPEDITRRIPRLTRRICNALYITGYARLDMRLTEAGELYLLEANPNPELSYGEDFSESAEAAGIDYHHLLERILQLGINYRRRR